MARLFTTGAEWADATAEGITGVVAGQTFASANPRSGSFHFRSTVGTNWSKGFTGAVGTTYYARVAAYYAGLPSSGPSAVSPVSFVDAGSTYNVSVRVWDDGHVDLVALGVVIGATAAGAIAAGSYNVFELALLIGVGSVDYCEARLNLSSIAAGSSLAISDNAPATLRWGQVATGTSPVDTDDVALNDSTGAAQTSWPGSGKVVLLKPISDSAVGTGWTLGTGTAISANSGSTAVKNTPPVGVTDLTAGSDTKQIRNATANANVNYDANLTTYTTAGVGASDTVNVLVPMVSTSAPVVTSAKLGNVGLASNPAITLVALGAGGTAGAFWSGVAGGTYPTGWKWSFGTTTYAPTVTLGTSPVMRIQQVTASTRIAVVDAMGMYVDYTPAVVAVTTPPKPTVVMQAVNRAANW